MFEARPGRRSGAFATEDSSTSIKTLSCRRLSPSSEQRKRLLCDFSGTLSCHSLFIGTFLHLWVIKWLIMVTLEKNLSQSTSFRVYLFTFPWRWRHWRQMTIMPLRNGCKESNEQTRKAFHGKMNSPLLARLLSLFSVKNGEEFLLKQARDGRRSSIQIIFHISIT